MEWEEEMHSITEFFQLCKMADVSMYSVQKPKKGRNTLKLVNTYDRDYRWLFSYLRFLIILIFVQANVIEKKGFNLLFLNYTKLEENNEVQN